MSRYGSNAERRVARAAVIAASSQWPTDDVLAVLRAHKRGAVAL